MKAFRSEKVFLSHLSRNLNSLFKVQQMNFNDKMKDKQQAEEKFYFDKEESK